MKRTPLGPGKPLTRRQEIQRKNKEAQRKASAAQRRRKIKSKRRAKVKADAAFAKHFHSPEHLAYVHSLPCLVCGTLPVDAHHVRSKGAGGTWRDLVPLCRIHHSEYHTAGHVTFERRYDLDLVAIAARVADHTPPKENET